MNKRPSFYQTMVFLASTHFMIHVYTQIMPAILPTIKAELGITLVQASLLLSVPMIVSVLTYLPSGILADRMGSRMILASFLVTAVGAYVVATSTDLPLLMVGSALLTLGSTMYHPPSLKASSMVDPSKMNVAMGAHLAGGSMGIAAGPLTLGFLMPRFGWRIAFYIWIPFTVLISLAGYYFMKHFIGARSEPQEETGLIEGIHSIFTPGYILVVSAGALVELVIVNLSGFTPTFFQEGVGMSESLSSFVFGIGPLAGIIGAFVGGSSGDRFGIYKSALFNLSVIVIFLVIIPFAPTVFAISIAYIVYRGMVSATMPLLNSMIASNSAVRNRSLAFSMYFVISNILGSMAPVVTGLLAERFSISIIFPISVLLLLPSMALIVYIKGREDN